MSHGSGLKIATWLLLYACNCATTPDLMPGNRNATTGYQQGIGSRVVVLRL